MSILTILSKSPAHPDLAQLSTIGGVALVPAAAGPADLTVICADGATLAIRYWRPADLLHSIREGDFDGALVALKQRSPWAYLLIGGVLVPNADGKVRDGDTITGWRWDAYQGALLTAQELGVGVVTLQHAQHVAATVEQLARRKRGPVKAAPAREGLFYSPAELLLLALPSIGETKAEQLLTYCGSPADALLALTADDLSVPGIGPKTRQEARRVLGLRDGEALGRIAGPELAAAASDLRTRKAA